MVTPGACSKMILSEEENMLDGLANVSRPRADFLVSLTVVVARSTAVRPMRSRIASSTMQRKFRYGLPDFNVISYANEISAGLFGPRALPTPLGERFLHVVAREAVEIDFHLVSF